MTTADVRQLELEVERYLAAVEVFRREGCEPHWADYGDTPDIGDVPMR